MRKLQCLTLIILTLLSAPTLAELSVAAGKSMYLHHERSKPWFEIRYFGKNWNHWSTFASTTGIGGELYRGWHKDSLETGLGIAFGSKDANVGTTWWYQGRFEWRFTPQFSVGGLHESNCRGVCDNSLLDWIPHGKKGEANSGRNYIYLRWRFGNESDL